MTELDPIPYRDGATWLRGRLARPTGEPRAAILVFPTIANANPPIERRARMLAEAGYLALIADFYGSKPESFEAAQAAANELRASVTVYRARLRAAFDCLAGLPGAAGVPLAAIGYCMGGQAALELARDGAALAGVVSFHGMLETGRRAEAGAIQARLLVCHGDADPLVPRAQVLAFWDEMDAAGAAWHFHAYSGVRHGFTDPGSDARGMAAIGYDASADRQSWAAMTSLFDEIFAG
ncbi:MAG: dienelactone hydrolase family protein [Novosphingobium sp.]